MSWKDKFPRENRYYETDNGILFNADNMEVLRGMPDNSVNTIITSPPYNKGYYRQNGGKGDNWKYSNIKYSNYNDNLKPVKYIKWQKQILNKMIRLLQPDGSIFYNHKTIYYKNKIVFPQYIFDYNVRQIIIWDRGGSPQIENVRFFPITEYIFWITKQQKTPKFYKDNGIFKKEIWRLAPLQDLKHPAPFPLEIPKNCIWTTTNENDIVLDPFLGSGTTAVASEQLNRRWIGIEISEQYCEIAKRRISHTQKLLL